MWTCSSGTDPRIRGMSCATIAGTATGSTRTPRGRAATATTARPLRPRRHPSSTVTSGSVWSADHTLPDVTVLLGCRRGLSGRAVVAVAARPLGVLVLPVAVPAIVAHDIPRILGSVPDEHVHMCAQLDRLRRGPDLLRVAREDLVGPRRHDSEEAIRQAQRPLDRLVHEATEH